MKQQIDPLIDRLLDEVRQHIVIDDQTGYVVDPVFGIKRNRVNAEICKTLLRTGDTSLAQKLIRYLIIQQNADGSWNEIHPNYNRPSALVTSFVGEAFLESNTTNLESYLEMAKNFVLNQEKKAGIFVKSDTISADHLNVDASCGSFLAQYGERFDDNTCLKAAHRVTDHVIRHQKNGVFPYTVDKGNYPYIFDVPCIHYQGVTIYYLMKIHHITRDDALSSSLMAGADWLASVLNRSGSFDWSKSGLMFSYYLGGASAFACAAFLCLLDDNPGYQEPARRALGILEKNINGLVLRWESDPEETVIKSIPKTLRTAMLGNYPVQHTLFRFGYGMYRQYARRHIRMNVDDRVFRTLCQMFGITSTTIEPNNNFPDMFMTSEVLDCLSHIALNGVDR